MVNSVPTRPELFFGLVGPIGCDISTVESELSAALEKVGYKCHHVSISKEMFDLYLLQKQNEGIRIRKKP